MKNGNPIYKLIFAYHTEMIEMCNIRQSLGLISDEKAEECNKNHCMRAIKAAYFGGFATEEAKKLFES